MAGFPLAAENFQLELGLCRSKAEQPSSWPVGHLSSAGTQPRWQVKGSQAGMSCTRILDVFSGVSPLCIHFKPEDPIALLLILWEMLRTCFRQSLQSSRGQPASKDLVSRLLVLNVTSLRNLLAED